MFHKKKWAKLTAAGLVFSLAATMAVGPAADADALAPPQQSYKWEDTYTYAWEGSVVAYKNGENRRMRRLRRMKRRTVIRSYRKKSRHGIRKNLC